MRYGTLSKAFMPDLQEQYDEAMFAFSTGDMPAAIGRLQEILALEPAHFDAQLSLGMAYYRLGDYAAAIREGLKAEQLSPKEQLVHTNLSLYYQKAGDKAKAEHHGLQARIASWRNSPESAPATDSSLEQAKPAPVPPPEKFPDMPWKKK